MPKNYKNACEMKKNNIIPEGLNGATNNVRNVVNLEIRNGKELPPGWEEAYDPVEGRIFWINHTRQETTWISPFDV